MLVGCWYWHSVGVYSRKICSMDCRDWCFARSNKIAVNFLDSRQPTSFYGNYHIFHGFLVNGELPSEEQYEQQV